MPSMKVRLSQVKTIVITVILTLLMTIIYANLRTPHKELAYQIENPVAVEDPAFPKSVGDLLDPAFVDGNKVQTLLNGDEIFPAMLEAIRGAKKTVTFESYIYWSGKIGEAFADALGDRARQGVKVHLLLDWAGSGKVEKRLLDDMRAAGVEIQRYHAPRWYNITRMNNRTHRKVLVVDGQIGFTGGVGIADEWTGNGLEPSKWRDTHYRVEGPVVNQFQSAFMDNWLKTEATVHSGPQYFPEIKPRGKALAQMFISSASEGGSSARIMYLMAIAGAKHSIALESAYFAPDQHTIEQLIAARLRGVEIKIIVPGPYTDSSVVDYASRELWGELLQAGVHIYQYQAALFHCKVLVIDEYFASVGSTNFDERSFRLNDEANLNIVEAAFAKRQLEDFQRDLKNSKEVSLAEWKSRPLQEKLLSKFSSLLNSQL
jgi:cardiolipin synthase